MLLCKPTVSFLFTHFLIAALFEIIDLSNPSFCTFWSLHIHQLAFVTNDRRYEMLKCPPPTPVTERQTGRELMEMEEWLLSPSCPPSNLLSLTLWLPSWLEWSRVSLFYPISSEFEWKHFRSYFFFAHFRHLKVAKRRFGLRIGSFPMTAACSVTLYQGWKADSDSTRKYLAL